jgi:hypothetical protein
MMSEIANAFEYDKHLARDVAFSNLVLAYNCAIEDAAAAAEIVAAAPDGNRVVAAIRELRITDSWRHRLDPFSGAAPRRIA